MVRAHQHAGDPVELCDSGDVSAMSGRQRLRLQQVQDITGEPQHFLCLNIGMSIDIQRKCLING
jgi:hypothetical protein